MTTGFLRQDVAYALRQLRKSAGFTVAAVLTLALGIGVNLTVFVILYGVLLRPLPFTHPEQLVRIERSYPGGTVVPAYSGTKALFMRRCSRAFQSAGIYDYIPSNVNLVRNGDAIPLKALRATSDFFRVFGMDPKIGRGFRAADMVPNAPRVVVLSDALWRQRFSADPDIVGQAVTLGNQRFTIIGVAPPEFRLDSKVDVWAPLPIVEAPEDHSNEYNLVARLRKGVTRARRRPISKACSFSLRRLTPRSGTSTSR